MGTTTTTTTTIIATIATTTTTTPTTTTTTITTTTTTIIISDSTSKTYRFPSSYKGEIDLSFSSNSQLITLGDHGSTPRPCQTSSEIDTWVSKNMFFQEG